MMYSSLLAFASNGVRSSHILLRQGKQHARRATNVLSSRSIFDCRSGLQDSASTSRSQSTASAAHHPPHEKPPNVELWETLATKELSKSKQSVDSLRCERITPV